MPLAIALLFVGLLFFAASRARRAEAGPEGEPQLPLPGARPPPPALPPPPPPGNGMPPFGATSPGQPTGTQTPPPELQAEIDRYLRTVNNPLVLTFFADRLEALGYSEAAELLRAKARAIQAGVDPFTQTQGVAGVAQSVPNWPMPPKNPAEFSDWVKQFVTRGKA